MCLEEKEQGENLKMEAIYITCISYKNSKYLSTKESKGSFEFDPCQFWSQVSSELTGLSWEKLLETFPIPTRLISLTNEFYSL